MKATRRNAPLRQSLSSRPSLPRASREWFRRDWIYFECFLEQNLRESVGYINGNKIFTTERKSDVFSAVLGGLKSQNDVSEVLSVNFVGRFA